MPVPWALEIIIHSIIVFGVRRLMVHRWITSGWTWTIPRELYPCNHVVLEVDQHHLSLNCLHQVCTDRIGSISWYCGIAECPGVARVARRDVLLSKWSYRLPDGVSNSPISGISGATVVVGCTVIRSGNGVSALTAAFLYPTLQKLDIPLCVPA